MKHPTQPLEIINGVLRFKRNSIVDYLAKDRLNDLAVMNFPQEDWEQLAQLIGYSLSGFGELSYVSDELYECAVKMQKDGIDERDARIKYLEDTLSKVRHSMKEIVPNLFKIHKDDLTT